MNKFMSPFGGSVSGGKKILSRIAILATVLMPLAAVLPVQAVEGQPQVCTPINLISGTATQTAGYTTTNPSADPLNPALYSGGSWSNSALATTAGIIPGPWVDPSTNSNFIGSGAQWISTTSAHPGDTGNGGQGLGTEDQWRLFKTDIVIPSGASVSPVTLYFTADNAATVYLNGTQIANTPTVDTFGPVPNPLDTVFSNVYSVTFTPLAGQTNSLAFVVRNSAFDISINPTGLLYNAQSQYCVPQAPSTVKVTIVKYLNNQPATASSTNSTSFPMNATWSAVNIGSGSGSFSLGPVGFNNPNPYQATTADMTSGASYGVSENLGTTCVTDQKFVLKGYTVGDTLALATAATPTTTAPSLSNITSDKFIIVWNQSCAPQGTVKVHILKYLDGQKATSTSAGGYQFPMTATWQTANLNGGATTTGSYVLGNNHGGAPDLYGADTALMQTPANYTTSEITNNTDITSKVLPKGVQCINGMYQLKGYTDSSISFADAATKTPTSTAPVYTGLTSDRYVIVWNKTCKPNNGDGKDNEDNGHHYGNDKGDNHEQGDNNGEHGNNTNGITNSSDKGDNSNDKGDNGNHNGNGQNLTSSNNSSQDGNNSGRGKNKNR